MKIVGAYKNFKNREKWVAIIGSRSASSQELHMAAMLGFTLAKRGDIVVSRLEEGIDIEAAKGALKAGGTVVAILGMSDNENILPQQDTKLLEKIKEKGCLIYLYDTKLLAEETDEVSAFSRRLNERDFALSLMCPTIVVPRNSDEIISDRTRWAVHYGKLLDQKVFRVDNNNKTFKYHKNPKVKECCLHPNTELDFTEIEKIDQVDQTEQVRQIKPSQENPWGISMQG